MASKTSIKSRLVSGLMLIVVFFIVQAGLVWYAIGNAKSNVVEVTRKNTIASTELGELGILAQQIRRYEKEYFVYIGNKERRDSYEREWRDALGKIVAMLEKMKSENKGSFSASEVAEIDKWHDATAFYLSEMEKVFLAVADRATSIKVAREAAAVPVEKAAASAPAGKAATVAQTPAAAPVQYQSIEANELIQVGKERFSSVLIKGVAAMEKSKVTNTLSLSNVAEGIFNNVLWAVMITVAVGILVALLLARNLPKAVAKTIDGLSNSAEEMSMGNLQKEYDAQGVTEFEKLAEALNRMRLAQQSLVERLQKRR